MKKIIALLLLAGLVAGCKGKKNRLPDGMTEKGLAEHIDKEEKGYAKTEGTWIPDTVYSAGLTYCYGTVWAGDRLLISNYGGEKLDPLSVGGKGYIMQLKDGVLSEYIPAGGDLNSPKGMAIYGDYLFVADISSVLVYNMKNLKAKPQVLMLPPNNVFVSDVAFRDNFLYISVRDAASVYMTEVKDPANMKQSEIDLYLSTVSGPNGMTIYKDTMYVMSYPVNDSIGEQNSIYMVLNMLDVNPMLYKLESLPGYYCGIQYDPVSRMVYYTDDLNGQLRSIDMATGDNKVIFPEHILLAPQMLTLANGKLYVPDVDESKLYVFTIPKK